MAVGDDHLRVVDQGHGDHHALAHAAVQLVGVGLRGFSGSGMPTWSSISFARARAAFVQRLVILQASTEPLADLVERMQRTERALEDHRHLLATELADMVVCAATSSSPSSQTSATDAVVLRLSRPITAMLDTLLPEPDCRRSLGPAPDTS